MNYEISGGIEQMSSVYEKCPVFENDKFLLRFANKDDASDLLKVYSDKQALPFFNSDNCDGDNFYYPTIESMEKAIDFWLSSYETKWFVRWVIVDKETSQVTGSVELFHRAADDDFNGVGVLRMDVGSHYEEAVVLQEILSLIVKPAYELFECDKIITKAPIYAVERIKALQKYGFEKSNSLLVGTNDHYAYNGYWSIRR